MGMGWGYVAAKKWGRKQEWGRLHDVYSSLVQTTTNVVVRGGAILGSPLHSSPKVISATLVFFIF